MWYVYILLCDQKTFYIGISDNPKDRLLEYRAGKSFFTKKFSELKLIYCEKYSNKHKAALRERQIKGWSKAKKKDLIEGKLSYNICTEIVEALGDQDVYP